MALALPSLWEGRATARGGFEINSKNRADFFDEKPSPLVPRDPPKGRVKSKVSVIGMLLAVAEIAIQPIIGNFDDFVIKVGREIGKSGSVTPSCHAKKK